MSRATRWLDRHAYPRRGDNWDNVAFAERVLATLAPSDVVLDLGAGAGIIPQLNFKGRARRVCGVDPDPRVRTNPFLDEGQIGTAERIPYAEGTFDLVVSANVLEHLPDPVPAFREVRRVLKPGGRFLVKTPNKWHYMPIVARLTPHGFHEWVNARRGRPREDTFPTVYRANTAASLRSIARASGLNLESVEFLEGRPEYLRMTAPTYLVGLAYERLVNASRLLARWRLIIIGEMSKPS